MADPSVPASNAPEITVSELSNALKRAIEDRFGYVRVRGEISGYRGPHSSGHAYFCLKDANARLDAVIWRTSFVRMKVKPEEGLEVVATGRLTTFPGKSSYQIVVEQLEPAGIGALMALLEARRRKLARKGPVRHSPQAPDSIPAQGRRRRHVADRRGHPRHSASTFRPFPGPGPGMACAGARGDVGSRGGGGDRWVQRPRHRRRRAEAGCADRGARRRIARGPVGLQRGNCCARRGAQRDSADRRGWSRDRLDADRPCRRLTRSDADRGRRVRHAGPGRADRGRRRPGRTAAWRDRRLGERKRADLRALVRALPSGEALVEGARQRLDRAGEALSVRSRGAVDFPRPTACGSGARDSPATRPARTSPDSPNACEGSSDAWSGSGRS